MSAAAGRLRELRLDSFLERRWSVPALLVALVGLSLVLRSSQLGQGFWIDEGISVGVAHHHWSSIPHVLRQDGSPPGYYMLLGLWIRVFGDSERATHALSLLFALASIPLAYAAARSIFDRLTGCRRRRARRVHAVPHVLRAGDADVRARGVPLAASPCSRT